MTETFPTVAAQHKAELEIAEIQAFQDLSRELVVNEKICAHARSRIR